MCKDSTIYVYKVSVHCLGCNENHAQLKPLSVETVKLESEAKDAKFCPSDVSINSSSGKVPSKFVGSLSW